MSNMGHAHMALGEYQKATDCYETLKKLGKIKKKLKKKQEVSIETRKKFVEMLFVRGHSCHLEIEVHSCHLDFDLYGGWIIQSRDFIFP